MSAPARLLPAGSAARPGSWRGPRLHRRLRGAALSTLLYVVLAIFFIPTLWIVLTSLRPNVEINASPPVWIPRSLTLDSFHALFSPGLSNASVPFTSYLTNSVVVALCSTVVALAMGTLAGYAFSRFRFRGDSLLFLGLMLARGVPGVALGLPLFVLFAHMGLIDRVWGLIIAYTALNVPFTTWLMDGFFRDVPDELDDAARVDGCSRWQTFWHIDLPLAAAGMAASGIFAFLTSWNEFQLASLLTSTTAAKTFPVGLFDFTSEFTVDWRGMCAMSVVMLIPAVVFVVVVQRNLIRGLTSGAVK